jgi:hypothetical protein
MTSEKPPYRPLLQCDACDRLQRHERAGSADVPELFFNQEPGESNETGQTITVEMWQCVECGQERAWGIRLNA